MGVDPVSTLKKTCTFDCVYCQVGRTEVFPKDREVFVPTEAILQEIRALPDLELDYITFAGSGEPTLAKNLGDMIRGIRSFRKEKIAVITNASLISRRDVQEDLMLADRIEAKLDASSGDFLKNVNHPMPEITLVEIVDALKAFRKTYRGHLTLQVMFIASNKKDAAGIVSLAREIHPDEIEINTPLRSCAVKPLPPEELEPITRIFREACGEGVRVRSVYESKREKSNPLCQPSTDWRRGKEPA